MKNLSKILNPILRGWPEHLDATHSCDVYDREARGSIFDIDNGITESLERCPMMSLCNEMFQHFVGSAMLECYFSSFNTVSDKRIWNAYVSSEFASGSPAVSLKQYRTCIVLIYGDFPDDMSLCVQKVWVH